jgi:hypothetical protein
MLPQLSTHEQLQRWKALQKNPIFPLSFQWALTVNTTTLPNSDASTLGQYRTDQIQQNTAYGIVGLRLSNTLKTITDGLIIAVSYLPTFTLADAISITDNVPDDAGNLIYRAAITQAGFNETFWIKNGPSSDSFFVEANRLIYVHLWATTAAIAAANMVAQGFLTLYAEFTGIRT